MLLDLLFPNRCIGCNSIIAADEFICDDCLPQVKFSENGFVPNNALEQRCRLLFPAERAFTLLDFEKEGLSRKIIHQLKYRNREKTGKILAQWTIDRLSFYEQKPDLIVTIPLHPKKMRKRGYNQLHLYADLLSAHYNIPADHEFLSRKSYSKAQALKDKQHRQHAENLFSINKKISGKHVLLIDDVYTTGNTAAAAAWEILANGNRISLLLMADDGN